MKKHGVCLCLILFASLYLNGIVLSATVPYGSATVEYQIDTSNAVVTYDVTSVYGLTVGSMQYNIDFAWGTFDGFYAGGTPVIDQDEAAAIASALNDLLDNALSSKPLLLNGINDTPINMYGIPYGEVFYLSGDPHIYYYDWTSNYTYEFVGGSYWLSPISWMGGSAIPDQNTNTYAQSVSLAVVSPVPVPGAVWLLGSGLIGLVGIRKKIRK